MAIGAGLAARRRPLLAALLISNACFLGAARRAPRSDAAARACRPRWPGPSVLLSRSSPRRSSSSRRTPSRCSCCSRCRLLGRPARPVGAWRRWSGALAALTRSIGLVLVLGAGGRGDPASAAKTGARWSPDWRPRPRSPRVRRSTSSYWGVAHQDALAPFDAQESWQRVFTFPLATLVQAGRFAWQSRHLLADRRPGGRVVLVAVLAGDPMAPAAVPGVRAGEPGRPAVRSVPDPTAAVDAAVRGGDLPRVLGPGASGGTPPTPRAARGQRSRGATPCWRCSSSNWWHVF